METTSLRTSIPIFFISTDAIFLGMFVIEFVMKVELSNYSPIFTDYNYAQSCLHGILYILREHCCMILRKWVFVQVYAQPVDYWKNYYNLFDFAVLVVSVMHEILLGVELGGNGVTFLRMAAGKSMSLYC